MAFGDCKMNGYFYVDGSQQPPNFRISWWLLSSPASRRKTRRSGGKKRKFLSCFMWGMSKICVHDSSCRSDDVKSSRLHNCIDTSIFKFLPALSSKSSNPSIRLKVIRSQHHLECQLEDCSQNVHPPKSTQLSKSWFGTGPERPDCPRGNGRRQLRPKSRTDHQDSSWGQSWCPTSVPDSDVVPTLFSSSNSLNKMNLVRKAWVLALTCMDFQSAFRPVGLHWKVPLQACGRYCEIHRLWRNAELKILPMKFLRLNSSKKAVPFFIFLSLAHDPPAASWPSAIKENAFCPLFNLLIHRWVVVDELIPGAVPKRAKASAPLLKRWPRTPLFIWTSLGRILQKMVRSSSTETEPARIHSCWILAESDHDLRQPRAAEQACQKA